jgi:acetyl esterase/lipase
LLLYPVTDADFETQTYHQFGLSGWLTRDTMKWFWARYLPDEAARVRPTASPLRASLDQLDGLPPALVITAENDVLRDEGEAYAQKLSMAGVEVTAVSYLGTIHDFMVLNPLANTPAPRAAIAQTCELLRRMLGTGVAAPSPGLRLRASGDSGSNSDRTDAPHGVTSVTSKITNAGGDAPDGPGFLAAKT